MSLSHYVHKNLNPDITAARIFAGLGSFILGRYWTTQIENDTSSLQKTSYKIATCFLLAEIAALGQNIKTAIMKEFLNLIKINRDNERILTLDDYPRTFEFLRVNDPPENPIYRVLYLAAHESADHNSAFSIYNIDSILYSLMKLKEVETIYKVIPEPKKICEAINEVSQKGPIDHLLIGAHGSQHSIALSYEKSFEIFTDIPEDCFSGLSPHAKIVLRSCLTGKPSWKNPNFAEWISWISGKKVIAPTEISNGSTCSFSEGELLATLKMDDKDITTEIDTTSSLIAQSLFLKKLILPVVLRLVVTWITARTIATILKNSALIADKIIYQSGCLLKTLAQTAHLYSPRFGEIIYKHVKKTCKSIYYMGEGIHYGMNLLIQPISNVAPPLPWFVFPILTIAFLLFCIDVA